MRSVIASALRSGPAGKLAENSDERRIKNRYEEHQNGHGQDRQKAARPPARDIYQRRARQKESNEHRSAVTHKDRRRVRVVNQKAQQGGRKNSEHQRLS